MDALIKQIIEENFHPDKMELINESHKHHGHAGDDGSGETHYTLIVVSSVFENMNRVEAQRLVLSKLGEAFDRGLHAISLKLSSS